MRNKTYSVFISTEDFYQEKCISNETERKVYISFFATIRELFYFYIFLCIFLHGETKKYYINDVILKEKLVYVEIKNKILYSCRYEIAVSYAPVMNYFLNE